MLRGLGFIRVIGCIEPRMMEMTTRFLGNGRRSLLLVGSQKRERPHAAPCKPVL